MNIELSIPLIFIGAVIAQGLFAAFALWLKPQNRKANSFLALLLIAFSLWLCDTFFRLSGIYQQNPDYYFLPIYYSLAFGPCLYFYSKSITQANFQWRWRASWHFLPVLIQASLYIFLQTQDYEFRRLFWVEVHYPITYALEFNLSLLSLIIYGLLSSRLLWKYQQKIKNQYSEISKISLHWLFILLMVIVALTLSWMIDAFYRSFFDYYATQPYSAIVMGCALLSLALGGILQSDLKGIQTKNLVEEEAEEKLSQKEVNLELLHQIQELMEKEAYYLEADISLNRLAELTKLNARDISHVINTALEINFMDFVNAYRVEEVKQKIVDPAYAHLTLLGIALESGFNSKSTFNRVFKKKEGISPSEYRKKAQNRN